MPGQPELQRDLVAWEVLFAKAPHNARFFYGPKDFDVLASVDRTLVKAIHFGIWDFLAVPLLRALKWIVRLHRKLRLVDHHPHRPDQPPHVPAAPQEREVDAADAGAPAADQGDPGSVREAEDDRPRAPEDEHGDHRAL